MSVWMTKSSGRDKEFIVLKHTLRGVNYTINGIKFRNGYAVVEKDSKTHRELKRIPVLKGSQEYPLIFLRKLPFITRPNDVKIVFGVDVFFEYNKQLQTEIVKETQEKKVENEIKHVQEHKRCSCKRLGTNKKASDNDLCAFVALEHSPSGYCLKHILQEPKLQEFGIDVPRFIPKVDKQKYRIKVSEELAKLKKEGKF